MCSNMKYAVGHGLICNPVFLPPIIFLFILMFLETPCIKQILDSVWKLFIYIRKMTRSWKRNQSWRTTGTGGPWKAPGTRPGQPGWPLGRLPPGASFSSEPSGWLAPRLENTKYWIWLSQGFVFNAYSWVQPFKGGDLLCKVVELSFQCLGFTWFD